MFSLKGISAAQPGWDVIFLLSGEPWIDVRPIACWGLYENEKGDFGLVEPLIRDKNGVYLSQPDSERAFKVSQPGESPERYVELAKEEKRQRRRAAYKANKEREKKEQEKKTSDDTAGSASTKSQAKKAGKRRPARRVHPKLKSLYHSISWRALVDPVEQEGLDVLYDFLVRACRIGKGKQASADQLFEHYIGWCKVFGSTPVERARVSITLKDLGAVGQKGRARIEQWKGVAVDVQALPRLPPEDKSIEARREAKQQMLKFIGCQINPSGWGAESLAKVYACYRAWCRRMDLHPLSDKQLAHELDRDHRAKPEGGSGKNRNWSGIRSEWPK